MTSAYPNIPAYHVAAVIEIAPVDFQTYFRYAKAFDDLHETPCFKPPCLMRFVGAKVPKRVGVCAVFSPDNYITPVDTPWLVLIPMCDNDVNALSGRCPFDRAVQRASQTGSLPKSMMAIFQARACALAQNRSGGAGCLLRSYNNAFRPS